MKRNISILIVVTLVAIGVAIMAILVSRKKETKYPRIAYIENELYYDTGKVCETVPRKMPDGLIETFVPAEIMPDMPNSANFGSDKENMEYMRLDEGRLIIHIGKKWYFFEKATTM